MKYSEEAVKKLIGYIVGEEAVCPNQLGLKIIKNCTEDNCKECWKQALAGDDKQ